MNKGLLNGAVIAAVFLAGFFTRKTFFAMSGPIVVDYWAFAAGVFLVGEGLWRLMRSKEASIPMNFLRLLRISIGVCIFTIHFLQFVRDGKLGG